MSACPTDEILGALVEGTLDTEERAAVTEHMDACDACRSLVIAAVRGRGESAAPLGAAPRSFLTERRIGSRVGRYELRESLGAGGMGAVYAAYDAELDRLIALKVMRFDAVDAAVIAERFVRESRIMAKLDHPSVITVYDAGRDGDDVFIAMELIRGTTLAAYLAAYDVGWSELVGLFMRVGEGLAAVHSVGIIHRDFKPENVLVELEPEAPRFGAPRVRKIVVTDFGIALPAAAASSGEHGGDAATTAGAAPGDDLRITATGAAIGTPAYMAPEQLDRAPLDARADQFSFAVSLWEALFGQRPYRGVTARELRAAMNEPLARPDRRVPRRLMKALVRGLARERDERWPDMSTLLRELAAIHRGRRGYVVAAAAAVVLGVVLFVVPGLARSPSDDPCAAPVAALSRAYGDDTARALATVFDRDPAARSLSGELDRRGTEWRKLHTETCHVDRDVVQDPAIAACLAARRIELERFAEGLLALDANVAASCAPRLSRSLGEPSACAIPAPGLLTPMFPDDSELNRKVTALRCRMYDVEADGHARSHFATAIEAARGIVADASVLWPPVHAEALYLLAVLQLAGGDSNAGTELLREVAAVAGNAHHEQIVASAWMQLVRAAAVDARDVERAIEYAGYAEAAVHGLGDPPALTTVLAYYKGVALVEAGRVSDGERELVRAYELAKAHVPAQLGTTLSGLGFLYERQGRYVEAAEVYERSIATLPSSGGGISAQALGLHKRLSETYTMLGRAAEAEAEARSAVEIAERTLAAGSLPRVEARAFLAEALRGAGRYAEALETARAAIADLRALGDEGSDLYEGARIIEASILTRLGRATEALPIVTRSCDLKALRPGAPLPAIADCWLHEASALRALGRLDESLARLDKALPPAIATYGDSHPSVADVHRIRGEVLGALGRRADAIEELEHAVAALQSLAIDPGYLAAAESALARELMATTPERALLLLESAVSRFAQASGYWAAERADATRRLQHHESARAPRRASAAERQAPD